MAFDVGLLGVSCSREFLMKALIKEMSRFLGDQDGPTVAEYGVMLALIIVGCFVAINLIGSKAKTMFANLESGLPDGAR